MPFKLRAQQITIDIPRSTSEPWVLITVQRVELNPDGSDLHVIDRWGTVNQKLANRYFDILPVHDPIDPGYDFISVAGIASAIKVAAVLWIQEKYGGTVDAEGNLIEDE